MAQDQARKPTGEVEATAAAQGADAHDRLNDRSAYQGCFGCGMRNATGLRLIFRQEGDEIVTEFTPDAQFQGFPGVAHGGILATLLDETLSRTATAAGRWMMTGRLEVRYRTRRAAGSALRISARAVSSRARMVAADRRDSPGRRARRARGRRARHLSSHPARIPAGGRRATP